LRSRHFGGATQHEESPVKRYVIDGKVMEPRDLRQLHRHMLEADGISSISDELRNLVESEWPVLAHKLPPKEPQK
jgi:hypothetical protein